MRATTIRFNSELWSLVEREARREGVSVAQFVRDAALFKIAYRLGERGEGPEGIPQAMADELTGRKGTGGG